MTSDQAQAKIYSAIDDLASQLETDSKALTTFLQAMGKFHKYSFGNTILILTQRPDASRVAGFHTWRSLDRHVKRGAKGIAILAPMLMKRSKTNDDDEKLLGFTVAHVFDVADTEGEPLPGFATAKGDPGPALHKLHHYANKLGIEVSKTDAMRTASGMSTVGKILLKADLSPAEEFGTLCHELCHECLHTQEERATIPKQVLELEAEAVAFVVSSAVGLDTNSAFSDYIKIWKGNPKLLRGSLDRIQKTASPILDAIL
jgi:hypothetical protein